MDGFTRPGYGQLPGVQAFEEKTGLDARSKQPIAPPGGIKADRARKQRRPRTPQDEVMPEPETGLLTLIEAAHYLRVSEATMRRWAKRDGQGGLPKPIIYGRRLHFRRDALDRFIALAEKFTSENYVSGLEAAAAARAAEKEEN